MNYFSSRTRDWYGRENPAHYFQSFQGVHKAMVYDHIPWGVVLDENITLAALKKFPVVVLPNVAIVSKKEVALFCQYVEEGGKLLVTGISGTRGRRGEKRPASSLEELIGAKFVRELGSTDNWVRFRSSGKSELDAPLAKDSRTDWPFLVRGPAVVYKPTTATAAGELLKPHRTTLHKENRYNLDWPLSAGEPVGPAALLHRIGKGAVLTLAASPDWSTASDHHLPEARRLLSRAVRVLHPESRITIQAPATVQAVVMDDPPNRLLRVHLLGYNTPPQTTPPKNRPYVLPVPIEDAPIHRITITTRDDIKSARAFNPSTRVRQFGGRWELLVQDIHEVILLNY